MCYELSTMEYLFDNLNSIKLVTPVWFYTSIETFPIYVRVCFKSLTEVLKGLLQK